MDSLHAVPSPRSPILVLAKSQGFGTYLGEILKAEGFNDFQMESPSAPGITARFLSKFDVVLLGETELTEAQAGRLSRYVKEGGSLIAIRPAPQLWEVFGISGAREAIEEGYVKIDGRSGIGKGFITDPLRFHGESHRYNSSDATVLASLYRSESEPTGSPAVLWRKWGRGAAAAFSYNLPQSIVLTRQGNPLHAGQEKDGILGIRAADMFTDGWVNPAGNALNQADEQMRLLSRVIETLSAEKRPLPRLWYFPGHAGGLVMLTDDGEDSREADLEAHLSDVRSRGARMTVYLKGDYIPVGTVRRWVSEGFEISGHVDDTKEAAHPTAQGMDLATSSTVAGFERSYGMPIRTVRNHWIVWCGIDTEGKPDFAAQARIEASHGIRFDCNLYHYDQDSSQGHFLGPAGSFTGSGLPMKFAAGDGSILGIYGSVTQLPDEQWGAGAMFGGFKLLLDRSLDSGIYSYINLNFHTDRWKAWSRPEGLKIIDYANARQAPIWTVAQTLSFIEGRAATRIDGTRWDRFRLSFRIEVPRSVPGVTLMLPVVHAGQKLRRISVDGHEESPVSRHLKGMDYAFLPVSPGTHTIVASFGDRLLNLETPHGGRPNFEVE
jgi:hypothetical protein